MESADSCGCVDGFMVLLANEFGKFGQISVNENSYEIRDLGAGKNVLVQNKALEETPLACSYAESMFTKAIPKNFKASSRDDEHCDVRLLVLYDQAAVNAEGSVAAVKARASLGVAQINIALRNSWVAPNDLRVTLVGIEFTSFYYGDLDEIVIAVSQLSQNANVKDERELYGADLVVFLTGLNYTSGGADYLGWTMDSTLDPDEAFAIVETLTATSGATGTYVFAHEFGHLMGCNHTAGQLPDNTFTWAHAHEFQFRKASSCVYNKRQTIVANPSGDISQVPILHYSNPSVHYYLGTPTGVANSNDNARQIQEAACVVAGHKTNVNTYLSVQIAGPDVACECDDVYLEAVIGGGVPGTYSFAWLTSTDGGITYGSVQGTLSWFELSMPCPSATNDGVFVKLTVTDPNQLTVSTTRFIEAVKGVNEYLSCQRRENYALNETGFRVFPNPNSGSFIVEFELEVQNDAVIQILSLNGELIMEKMFESLSPGNYTHAVNGIELTDCIYLCRFIQGNKHVVKKVVVVD